MSIVFQDHSERHDENLDLHFCAGSYFTQFIQAWIAQLVVHQLGIREVLRSNPGEGENFSM